MKGMTIKLLQNLRAIDYKLLDSSVTSFPDGLRRAALKKALADLEMWEKQGKGYVNLDTLETRPNFNSNT